MAADFDKPTLDSEYTNVVQDIRDNDKANALMFAGISVSNIPIGAIQFAGGVFGTWNGASFDVTPVSIGGGGTGATNAVDARNNLDVLSSTQLDAAYMRRDSNGSDIDDVSIFRTSIDVYSEAESDAITDLSLLKTDNLFSVGSAQIAFNNIKQNSSTTFRGVVEKATTTEARAGTAEKYPDSAGVHSAINEQVEDNILTFKADFQGGTTYVIEEIFGNVALNVQSITRIGAGNIRINHTIGSTDYVVQLTVVDSGARFVGYSAVGTTSFEIFTRNGAETLVDEDVIVTIYKV